MRIGSLFSGIGGLELGLERAGVGTVAWQCEADPYCRRVLAKHWPGVPIFEDVRTLTDPPDCEVLCGGWPCQDISKAGKGAGLDGERSGLFFEFVRIVRMVRPQLVVMENVPALTVRGLGVVLGELARAGLDAQWGCLSAAGVGAPHLRRRIFIVAYPNDEPNKAVRRKREAAANQGLGGRHPGIRGNGDAQRQESIGGPRQAVGCRPSPEPRSAHWESEPGVGRVADGVSSRVDRLRALGNAVVPQVAEYVGNRILAAR